MNNMRIVHDNAADRATLTASSAASADLAVTFLLTESKSDVYRSTGTSVTLTATWAASEIIGGVFLPFCNLTSEATMRVRGYADAADVAPLFDTGAVECCPAPPLGLWNWNDTLGANSFAYGGGTYARAWVDVPGAVEKLVIDIVDPTNPAGYIEAARLVCGGYWSPEFNPNYGAPVTVVDTTSRYRTDGGDQKADIGTKHRKQVLDLSHLGPADLTEFWSIATGCGGSRPVLVSLYPNHENTHLEQTRQIYGRLVADAQISTPGFQQFATAIEQEEI